MLDSIYPDWSVTDTIDRLQNEFTHEEWESVPLEQGPGWYLGKHYTVLLMPAGGTVSHVPIHTMHVWNNHLIGETFNWAVNAPTRMDLRE